MRNYIWSVRVKLRTIGSASGAAEKRYNREFNVIASSIDAVISEVSHKGEVVKVVRGAPVDYVAGEGSREVEE